MAALNRKQVWKTEVSASIQSTNGIFVVEEHIGTIMWKLCDVGVSRKKDDRPKQQVEMKKRNISASLPDSNEIPKATPTCLFTGFRCFQSYKLCLHMYLVHIRCSYSVSHGSDHCNIRVATSSWPTFSKQSTILSVTNNTEVWRTSVFIRWSSFLKRSYIWSTLSIG